MSTATAIAKICTSCRQSKPLDHFHRDNGRPVSRCKACASARSRRYYVNVRRALVTDGTGTNYRMSDERRAEIIRRYNAGESTLSLGRSFGFDPSTLQEMFRRRGVKMREAGASRAGHKINESAFDEITDASAYWVGFLMADGCVVERGGSASVNLSISACDVGHVEAFRAFLGGTQKIHITKNSNHASQPLARYTVGSRRLADALAKLGVVPNKSATAKAIGLECNAAFWRGVIDGDGCVRWAATDKSERRYPQIRLVGSHHLVSQFADFCEPIASRRNRVRPMHTIWQFGLTGAPAAAVIRVLYASATIALPRKHAVAIEILNRMESTNGN